MGMNPFKLTAGKMPPILIGRQDIADDFVEALDNGAGAPGRLMLITGQRGCGKTVMLSELRRIAIERGWVVISETASRGMCERLVGALAPRGIRLADASINPSIGIAGVANASLGSLSFSTPEQGALTLRAAIGDRLKKLPKGKGIVFAIDEAQAASTADMIALATTFQHVLSDQDMTGLPDSEQRGVALVFAGLPSLVDDLLENEVLTFLRRSQRQIVGDVPLPDARDAYVQAVRDAGKSIDVLVATAAARAAGGHPYLLQLVGYYMWRASDRRGSSAIEACDVEDGAADAMMAFYDAVCAPLYYGLRSPQRLFVEAMAKDDPEPSRMSDITQRARRTASWTSKYRASLIRERVIEPAGYGIVRLSVPYLGAYMRDEILWKATR
ncbi:MAG: ATP-binding protein [Slackia sp.]|nr:ATP-binding protein [Slackia sp.]